MSSLRPQDRKSLCRFTFADGRQCRTPRSLNHPHLCSDHARKDSQARAADKLARELSYFFSGEYLSACDLSAALGRLIAGVARGDINPVPPAEQHKLDALLDPARQALANTACATAWLEGWAIPVEKAIEEVLMPEAESASS